MARILITSGPTRQYLDPVRYLTNGSSGRMGAALAAAAVEAGHEVVVVSGPVQTVYPPEAKVVSVLTTDQMLEAACEHFEDCDGAIGAAAPCDYQPRQIALQKISKSGQPYLLELIETPDVIATLGQRKRADQWVVGFALETEDRHFRAIVKLERKHCDLMISNGPEAIDADTNQVEVLDRQGTVLERLAGSKTEVAKAIFTTIETRLIRP
ncbi:phosphopantothenoylcysteine decarboxylase [Roseimaritima sediminicola]|uniref:phosphopantothenoylcysteine decarboxylase n=1 Tax=Roseimaritima sediminicola TaxID=2662066 RepID=UPI001F3FDA6F|nr:phosphopantothenoylcysteine decarboxylase [Roseimaritima sediminicola]